ncbi:MAG: putative lipid II flippase FtsW [Alphaproteobacteria bacterium]|nr:putative lipid II flippase FtsW [Alphaproteobacteria bacterium]
MKNYSFARTDTSAVGRWWWTVDHWTLGALAFLIAIGVLLTLSASPAVAQRIGAQSFHFVYRQFVFVPLAVLIIVGISLQSPKTVRRIGAVGFLIGVVLMMATLVVGVEVKGATRWINVPGLSLQPSEFIKPTFAVVTAWMFSEARAKDHFPGDLIAVGLFGMVIGLLLLQPDVGMSLVVSAVWCTQFFLAGLSLFWVLLLVVIGLGSLVGAYFIFPHVASRVDRFLDPSTGDTYQIAKAMQAFSHGGLLGTGPGEGRVKEVLPDAHTDFIFAVAGEEFGLILCLFIVGLFAFIVLRGFVRVMGDENLFILLAVGGLSVQFGLQALINMASSLRLMPTKGMTLPFISYGGSSMLARAVGMGMLLALTRRRTGTGELG